MMTRGTLLATLIAAMFAAPVFAQTVGSEVQRNINQQNRIEQGLQSGQLTTKEASQLERGEANIERTQSNALRDGSLNNAEKARIQRAQNRLSNEIYEDKHNGRIGNPNSASSQRLQTDIQRNINQQSRIEQGIKSDALTNREVGTLERGQAHVDRKIARAGADGFVGRREQARIQSAENHQSNRIYRLKHNNRVRP